MNYAFPRLAALLLAPLETLYQEHGHEWSL